MHCIGWLLAGERQLRKAIITAALIVLITTSAHAYRFKASWDAPSTGPTPDGYTLYVCDQPITSSFGGTVSDADLVGKCQGKLQTFETVQPQIETDYVTDEKSLTLYFRVSSRINHASGGDNGMIESDLSEQAQLEFTTVEVQVPRPPGKPSVEGPKVILVMP